MEDKQPLQDAPLPQRWSLASLFDAKSVKSGDFVMQTLTLLGTFSVGASLIGLIAKALGAADEQVAGISIYVIMALYIVRYRGTLQKIVKVYSLLICIMSVCLLLFLFKNQISSTFLDSTLTRTTGIIKITPKANDFLPSLATYISEAKQEVWFTGMSFYVTLPQHRDTLMKKLEEGVDVRFLIYDPLSKNLHDVASGFSQSDEALRNECDLTIQNLQEMLADANRRNLPGRLEIKLFSSVPRTRMYVFDRKMETGTTYFIPHVDQQNTPNLPGFLVKNIKTGITQPYFEGIERLWNTSQPYETWLALHPERQQHPQ